MIKKIFLTVFLFGTLFQSFVATKGPFTLKPQNELIILRHQRSIFEMLSPDKFNALQAHVLQNPASINARDERGATPLHRAVEFPNNDATVLFLQGRGADFNAKDSIGNRPLHYALKIEDNQQMVKMLLQGLARPLSKNNHGETPLHVAAILGRAFEINKFLQDEVVRQYIDVADNNGNTALMYALAKDNNFHIVRKLIQADANPVHKNRDGKTPLHLAAKFKRDSELNYFFQSYELKDFVDVTDNDGATPLMYALRVPYNRILVDKLINNGAKQDKFDNANRCVLSYAMSIDENEYFVERFLPFTPLPCLFVMVEQTPNNRYRKILNDWIQKKDLKEINLLQNRVNLLPANLSESDLSAWKPTHFMPIEQSKGLIVVDPNSHR